MRRDEDGSSALQFQVRMDLGHPGSDIYYYIVLLYIYITI